MALVGEQGLPVQVQRKDGSLLLKEASVIGVGRPKLTGRAVWPKALLLVRTQSLDFRFSPTYLETQTNNAYPGAEGTTPHLIQMGHRRSHDQLQLVVMEPSVPVFVADIGARYMSFTWAGNAVQPAAPSMSEYGAFVIAYTRTILKRHPDLLWAKKTLQANGVGNMWPNDLANQLSELSREPRR